MPRLASWRPRPAIWFAAAGAPVWLCSCASGPYEVPPPAMTTQRIEVPFTHEPLRLVLGAHGGHVLVRAARRLSCTAEVRVHAASARELEARLAAVRVEVDEDELGERTRIAVVHASDPGLVDVSWVLHVPPRVALAIHSPAAEVAVRGYAGALQLEGGTGAVRLDLGGGDAEVTTTTAPVRVRGLAASARVRTASGAIEALLPPAPHDVDWRLQSDTGRIDVAVPVDRALHITCEAPRGAVTAAAAVRWLRWATPRPQSPRLPDLSPDPGLVHEGVVGPEEAPYRGELHIGTRSGAVAVRLLPGAAAERSLEQP